MKGRALKKKVYDFLKSSDFDESLNKLIRIPGRKVINPLFSFLYNSEELIRWRAITAMGRVVSHLAKEDLEAARVILRRIMWNLNDESGGIGWGSAEAMGEILANEKRLAEEYTHILISYIKEDGNFQENEHIQSGVLWGLGRLSQVRPDLVKGSASLIFQYFKSLNDGVRGTAVWTAGILKASEAREGLKELTTDRSVLYLYRDNMLMKTQVSELATEALKNMENS
jgi:HEAT repeat protein